MRKLLTLVTLCVLCGIDGFAQYTETKDITPLGFSGNFEFLQFSQTRGLLAISDKNVLYISTDTAKTWKTEKLPTDTVNQFIMYKDGLTGFITNSKGAYRTLDGGITWEKMPLTGIPSKIDGYEVNLVNLYFKTKDVVFYILTNKVNGKRIYKSSDCGNTWKEVAKDIYPYYRLPVGIIVLNMHWNDETGYLYGNAFYAKTEDGGETWTKYCYDESLYEVEQEVIWSYDNGAAIISEDQHTTNRVFFSKDGNPTEKYNVQLTGDYYLTMAQDINGHLYALNDHGDFWHSTDSAKTWTTKSIGGEYDYLGISGMHFFNEMVGVVVGYNLTSYVTEDGGETWAKYVHEGADGFSQSSSGIYVKDENEVFITGNTGRLFHSLDGGDTWEWQDIHNDKLYEIEFPTPETGYIIGPQVLLKTVDGGNIWEKKKLRIVYAHYIDFLNENVGYIGYSSMHPSLHKTINGGANVYDLYDPLYDDNKNDYTPFSFLTETKGLVCADNGNLLYTGNGGDTWELKSLGFGENDYMESIVSVGKQGWLLNTLNEETTKIYYIDTLFNVSIAHEFDEDEGKGYYLKKVNDSLFYISMYKDGERTLYFGNLTEWHRTNIPVKSATYAYNEHVVYTYDVNTTTIYKTIVYDDSLQVSLQKESSYKYTLFSNVQNVPLNLFLTNGTGEVVWSGQLNSGNGESTIDFPETIENGSYLLHIESGKGYYYKKTEPIEVILKADDTPVMEVSQEKSYTLYGRTLYVCDANAKLYTVLGVEIPIQNGVAELKAGVYILQTTQGREKVVVR